MSHPQPAAECAEDGGAPEGLPEETRWRGRARTSFSAIAVG